jgi:hypothetical protein
MTEEEKTQRRTLTTRLGEYLLRERNDEDSNERMQRMMRINVMLSFLTLCAVVGVEGARDLILLLPFV